MLLFTTQIGKSYCFFVSNKILRSYFYVNMFKYQNQNNFCKVLILLILSESFLYIKTFKLLNILKLDSIDLKISNSFYNFK